MRPILQERRRDRGPRAARGEERVGLARPDHLRGHRHARRPAAPSAPPPAPRPCLPPAGRAQGDVGGDVRSPGAAPAPPPVANEEDLVVRKPRGRRRGRRRRPRPARCRHRGRLPLGAKRRPEGSVLLRRLYGDRGAALVVAAVRADPVREVGLAAVRARLRGRGRPARGAPAAGSCEPSTSSSSVPPWCYLRSLIRHRSARRGVMCSKSEIGTRDGSPRAGREYNLLCYPGPRLRAATPAGAA